MLLATRPWSANAFDGPGRTNQPDWGAGFFPTVDTTQSTQNP